MQCHLSGDFRCALTSQSSARRVGLTLCLAAGWALGACAAEVGHPPVARASAVPSRIPENDGFQTLATLDATNSADPIDDPDGEHSLTYRWSIEADEFRFEEGAERSAIASVRFRGDRPALVSLTATDEDGLSNTASFQMQLTIE